MEISVQRNAGGVTVDKLYSRCLVQGRGNAVVHVLLLELGKRCTMLFVGCLLDVLVWFVARVFFFMGGFLCLVK